MLMSTSFIESDSQDGSVDGGDDDGRTKSDDSDEDGELKKEKKKKIIAELFGTNSFDEEPKPEEKLSAPPSKSDWLELKEDTDTFIPATTTTSTTRDTTDVYNFKTAVESKTSSSFQREPNLADRENGNFVENKIDRRRSATDKTSDSRKLKQRFKSLDLDLLDFDSSSIAHPNSDNQPLEQVIPSADVKEGLYKEKKKGVKSINLFVVH
jgi:hypothetical protein